MRESTYFNKLMKIIDGSGYECLMKALYRIDFHSKYPLDENLERKVMDFRWEMGYVGMDKPSLFEVLVIMSMDCERNIMHKTEMGNRTAYWYWAMMQNLGFQYLDDEEYGPDADDFVVETCDILLSRMYNRDGSGGGLFQLKNCKEDLRYVPFWIQLTWWLKENFTDEFRIEVT